MKKFVRTMGIVTLILVSCWFIGQEVKERREGNQINVEQVQEDIEQAQEAVSAHEQSPFHNLVFEGAKETEDNPWKQTAGLFEMEGMGEVIFLTPNTSALLETEAEKLEFQCQIHPWVKESSDGAGILVWLIDQDENIIHEEEWSISSEEEWQKFSLDLALFEAVTKVKMFCNNGIEDDDSGDWVVIKRS